MVSSFLWYTCTEKLGLLPTGVEQKRITLWLHINVAHLKAKISSQSIPLFIDWRTLSKVFETTFSLSLIIVTTSHWHLPKAIQVSTEHTPVFLLTSQNAEKIYCLTQKGVSLKLRMKVQKWEICTVLEIPREASVN